MIRLAFDGLLGVALLATALGALFSRDLFRGVVLFVVFGLLMAMAWIRLQAPDLALAEAAIGAGLTGALLLDAIGHLKRRNTEAAHEQHAGYSAVAGARATANASPSAASNDSATDSASDSASASPGDSA